jgi:hypothetical protein
MKRVLRWLGGASSFLYVISCLVPVELPQRCNPIEDSWIQILHLAFIRHLQFGREIVFTFGPWGFLYAGYRPETHWLAIGIWLVLAVIFWLTLRQIARLSFKSELTQWVWIMGLTSIVGIAFSVSNDVRLICWPFLLLVLHFFHQESSARIRSALIIALALLSLVKFTLFVGGVIVICAIAAETVLKRKRFPWSIPLYAASVVLFWLLAAQKPGSFRPYLLNSWQVASGYTEAMMSNGAADVRFGFFFATVAFIALATTAWAAWKRIGLFSIFTMGAMAFLTFTVLKYGFVRAEHESEASLQMIAVTLICLAVIWPAAREQRSWFRAAGFFPIGLAYLFAVCSFHRFDEPSLLGQWAATFSPSRWLAPIEVTYLGKEYQQAWEQQLSGYTYQFPFPTVKGEADYYSARQVELFAHGVPYRPRPVFQSYCAFTPALAKLNADHLRSDHAAQFIVFDNFALDKRYPSLDDGLSWPEILTRYDVQDVDLYYTLLSRSKTPRKFTLVPLSDSSVKLGEAFSMPAVSNGLIWAEIEVNRTLAGSAISAFFKPAMLFLNTTLRDGEQYTNSFLPGMGRAGFLLSPRVNSSISFASLGRNPRPSGLIGDEVTSFSICQAAHRFPVDCYHDSIRVRLFRLEFPEQRMEDVPGLARLAELMDVWQKNLTNRCALFHSPDAGTILSLSSDSRLCLGSPGGYSHLELGFGISPPTDDQQNPTGVTFRASTLDKHEHATPFWSQHINPAQDKGKHLVSLDLGTNEISNVLIETIPDETNSVRAISPYWYRIHFE